MWFFFIPLPRHGGDVFEAPPPSALPSLASRHDRCPFFPRDRWSTSNVQYPRQLPAIDLFPNRRRRPPLRADLDSDGRIELRTEESQSSSFLSPDSAEGSGHPLSEDQQ